jgi:hypothetical protein
MNSRRIIGILALISLPLICKAAIVYPQVPAGGEEVVMQYEPLLKPLAGERIQNWTIAKPFGFYVDTDLTNVLAGKLLSTTRLAAWRYMLIEGTKMAGAVDLNADEKQGKLLKFQEAICPSSTGYNYSTLEALGVAEALPQVKKEDYEFRYLSMAPIGFFAVWLHGKTNDIIIPLPPTYDRYDAYRTYSEAEITKLLIPEIKRDIVMWKKLNDQRLKNNDAYKNAMMNYEKSHGDKCGVISLYGMGGPFQYMKPNVQTMILQGMSSKCGLLNYKVKITYADKIYQDVKQVEVLEKITNTDTPEPQ